MFVERSPSRWFAVLLATSCVLASAPAVAQDAVEQAAQLDRDARALFESGDFAGAASKFASAYEVAPHPATRYNEAMAWDRAGKLGRAADGYRATLNEEGLDEARAEAARERLEQLVQAVGRIEIPGPEGGKATVAHVQNASVPVLVHLMPGQYSVSITDPNGKKIVRSVSAKAGQTVELLIEVTAPVEREVTPPPPPDKVQINQDSSSSTWGWVAVGSAAALGGAGAYLGVKTLQSRDAFEDSGRLDADERDSALRYRTWTNIALGAAAVTGTVGVVLLLSDGDSKRDESAAKLQLTPMGAKATWVF